MNPSVPRPLRRRPAAVLVLAGLAACGGERAATSVLLVTFDTTRSDRLGCYGGPPGVSPVIDEVAGRGLVFGRAFAPVPLTLPGHATLLTGLLPASHGVHDNALYRLPDDATTLAEVLGAQGYDTAAFVGAFVLDGQFGLSQGFRHYDDAMGPPARPGARPPEERPARVVTDAAVQWLVAPRAGPFFLWVHYYDPHFPYDPPEDTRSRLPGLPYEAEIAAADAQLGRLLRALEDTGQREHTLVVLTADHGEGLGDHGEETHGYFLYQSTLHVPLIFQHPALPRGAVSGRVASLADVLPTVLSFLELPLPEQLDGVDLLSAEPPSRELVLETELPRTTFGFAPYAALFDGRFKLIDAPQAELYDLEEDPEEARDLAGQDGTRVVALRARLAALHPGAAASAAFSPEEDALARIQALGYTTGSATAQSVRADWTRAELLHALDLRNQARSALLGGDWQASARHALALEKVAPGCAQAFEYAGTALARQGLHAEARDHLLAAIALQHDLPDAHWNLANCYFHLGQVEDAKREVREVVAIHPEHVAARRVLADLALQAQDLDAAREHLERILQAEPESAEARWARTVLQDLPE